MKRCLIVIALFAAAAVAGVRWGWVQQRQLAFEVRREALLEAESQRLRETLASLKKSSPENIAARREIERSVAEIRELRFVGPVDYDVLSRQGIKKTLEQKLSEQYSAAEFANVATGYSALGLLPRGYPLAQKYVDLLGEQVAAFYDQHQHKLFMFEDASLDNAQNRIILAHELTHALQDQNFGLLKLPLEIKDNDDRAIAASALVEGDATLVMSEYMVKDLSMATLRDSLGGILSQNMDQLQKAPRFLREMMVFPYLRGQQFCLALQMRGGYQAISGAYKNPPSSSAQILHPEKYLAEPREEPIPIEWPDTTALGEKPLADNVLGELGTRLLLVEWEEETARAERAAEGWLGDRYLVFNKGDAFVWKTLWADRNERTEFEGVLLVAIGKNRARESWKFDIWDTGENGVVLVGVATEQWRQALNLKFSK